MVKFQTMGKSVRYATKDFLCEFDNTQTGLHSVY